VLLAADRSATFAEQRRYCLIVTSLVLTFLLLVSTAALWPVAVRNEGVGDVGRIPLFDSSVWYRDMGGRSVAEIQELDLFYHNIGPSIAEAKRADIILLGPSFMLYAMDAEELRAFGKRHGLKIYNMAFFGVRSGRFTRELIERWSLHPKLWIINVDDNFDHFFSTSPNMWWFGSSGSVPIPAMIHDRFVGWRNVARRNLRWRLEDANASILEGQTPADHSVYRRIDDGSVYLDHDPRFRATDNKTIDVVREPACHTNPDIISIGRNYLASIGSEAILTLVPNNTWCPLQAIELGKELNKEVILPPNAKYSTVDNGGHLDHVSAVSLTRYLLDNLEKSAAFQAMAAR
jgi:hypothetical protein